MSENAKEYLKVDPKICFMATRTSEYPLCRHCGKPFVNLGDLSGRMFVWQTPRDVIDLVCGGQCNVHATNNRRYNKQQT